MPDTLPNTLLILSHLIFTRALFFRQGRGYMIYCRLHNYNRGRAEIWIFLVLLITVVNTSNDSFHLLNARYVSGLCCSEKSIILLDVAPHMGVHAESCPTLWNLINSSLPGFSVHENVKENINIRKCQTKLYIHILIFIYLLCSKNKEINSFFYFCHIY